MLCRVRTLTSHNAEESENNPESPHLGEIKRMRKQCVPGASPFLRAPGTRLTIPPDGQKGFYLLISPGGTAVCLSLVSHSSRFTFEAVQLFTRNAQAPKPPSNRFETTSGGEFLSDAPFFGLFLWTEFKLANCACASGWSSTLEP